MTLVSKPLFVKYLPIIRLRSIVEVRLHIHSTQGRNENLPMPPSTPEIGIDYSLAFAFCRLVRDGSLCLGRELFETARVAGDRLMQVHEKPCLGMTGAKGEPMTYECSLCGQLFPVPDEGSPEDAAAELTAAFQEHVGTCRGSEGMRWVGLL